MTVILQRLTCLPRAGDPTEHLRHLATAARLWPEQDSDTALFLRASTVVALLRAGRPWQAGALLAGWPLRPTPGFIRRSLPWLARRKRRRLAARWHRAWDGVDLDARPSAVATQ